MANKLTEEEQATLTSLPDAFELPHGSINWKTYTVPGMTMLYRLEPGQNRAEVQFWDDSGVGFPEGLPSVIDDVVMAPFDLKLIEGVIRPDGNEEESSWSLLLEVAEMYSLNQLAALCRIIGSRLS